MVGLLLASVTAHAQPTPARAPRVAILSTKPGAEETELYLQPVDAARLVAPVARIHHLPDAIVRGAVVPQASAVVAIADTIPKLDPSWGASLLLVAADREPVPLLENVYHGTRPLVLPDGRVFVLAGTEGKPPSDAELEDGRLRVDTLEIYELDLERSERKVIYRSQGYIAYLAGALDGEIIVYEVGPDRAQLIAIDATRPDYPVRDLWRPLPPFARDFSIDVQNRTLIFTNSDETDPSQSIAQRVDLRRPPQPRPRPPLGSIVRPPNLVTLDRSKLHEVRAFAWPGRGVAVSKDLGKMLVKDAAGAVVRAPPRMPAGVNVVRDFYVANRQTWAIILNRPQPGRLAQVLRLRAEGPHEGEARPVATPAGTQLDVAGVVPPDPADLQVVPPILKERPVRKPPNWIPRDLPLRLSPDLRRGVFR